MFDRYNDDWERLAWVLLRGRASLVTDAGEKAQAVALRRKYPQYRTMALEERPLIRSEPERAANGDAGAAFLQVEGCAEGQMKSCRPGLADATS